MTADLPIVNVNDASTCRRCDYMLRGIAIDGVCPECGMKVALSLMTPEQARLCEYEDRLLRSEAKYRAFRRSTLELALLMVIVAMIAEGVCRVTGKRPPELQWGIIIGLATVPLWLSMAYGQHARVKHIESIRESRARSPR